MTLEVIIKDELFILSTDEPVTMKSIACVVAQAFGVTLRDLKNSSQGGRHISRHVAMFLIREYHGTNRSFRVIAHWFSLKDDTTVLHACELMRTLMKQDEELREKVEELKQIIGFNSMSVESRIEK